MKRIATTRRHREKTWYDAIKAKVGDRWDEKKIGRVARYAETKGMSKPKNRRDVAEIEDQYDEWRNSAKPRQHFSARRAGSLHRLMRYIDLKRELASPGLLLSPDRNLRKLRRSGLGSNPFSNDEVVEVTLTFTLDKSSEDYWLLDAQNAPGYTSLSRWLKQIASTLEPDTPHRNSEKVHAEIQHYASASEWKAERVMGDHRVAHALLTGIPAVVEIPGEALNADTSLVILEAELPPAELERIWDDSRVSKRAVNEFYPVWSEAVRVARAESDNIDFEEFWEYFTAQIPALMEQNDQEFERLSGQSKMERLLEHVPEYAAAFRGARYAALKEERLGGQSLEEKKDFLRKLKLSEKQTKPYSLQQEVLGRVAFEVCLDGLWFGDTGFVKAVWENYKEQAGAYGLEPAYYTNEPRTALDRIGRYLRKTEGKIREELKQPSPFRCNA
jgi:hypothetical protein